MRTCMACGHKHETKEKCIYPPTMGSEAGIMLEELAYLNNGELEKEIAKLKKTWHVKTK